MAEPVARARRRFEELPWPTVARVAVCVGILALLVFLGAAALLPRLLGWSGTTVVTGSMEPRIRPGDIALSSPIDPDELRAGQVISFRDPSGFTDVPVLHRIVEVRDDGTFTTQGDANRNPDSTPVAHGDVIGIGRLLVPAIGKPVIWLQQGDALAFGLFVAAIAVLVRGAVPLPIGLGRRGRRLFRAAEIATATVAFIAGGYLVFYRGTGEGLAEFSAGTDTSGSSWESGEWAEEGACRVRWSLSGNVHAGGSITIYNDGGTAVPPLWTLAFTFTGDQVIVLSGGGGTAVQNGPSVEYTAADWMGPIAAGGYNAISSLATDSASGVADEPPEDFRLNGTPCELI